MLKEGRSGVHSSLQREARTQDGRWRVGQVKTFNKGERFGHIYCPFLGSGDSLALLSCVLRVGAGLTLLALMHGGHMSG
jgi:hypothetical protein